MVLTNFSKQIFIISLKERTDRQNSIETNLNKINMIKNIDYKFWLVDKHEKGSVYGSYHSHLSIIKYSLENNYDDVMILEDDAYFDLSKINLEKVCQTKYFLENNKDWDLFYLGGMILYKDCYINSNIIKGEWILVHSYIINRKCMEYIINHEQILPDNFCFTDYYYNILNKLNKYGLNETICFQTESPSNNDWPLYLNVYKCMCSKINIYLKKTDIYVMIVIFEFLFNLIPVIILKYMKQIKNKYNNFRYIFYKKYGKTIPYIFFWLFPPL